MTRTISLIIGIAVTALVVAVPTALGEGRLAGTQEQDSAAVAPDWFERAAIVAQSKAKVAVIVSERTPEPQSLRAERLRSEGLNRMYGLGEFATVNGYVDSHERAVPPASTTPISVTGSDSEIQWPQVGVGFGVGILLLLGLGLTMRAAHVRPFAH